MIGKLIHAVQSSDEMYLKGIAIIKAAEKLGLFAGITINPSPPIPETNQQT